MSASYFFDKFSLQISWNNGLINYGAFCFKKSRQNVIWLFSEIFIEKINWQQISKISLVRYSQLVFEILTYLDESKMRESRNKLRITHKYFLRYNHLIHAFKFTTKLIL